MRQPLTTHLRQIVREGLLIIISAIALFLLLALFSYHQTDPGWVYSYANHPVANIGGRIGAWFANIFLYLFGYTAYLFPFMLVWLTWFYLRMLPKSSILVPKVFALRVIGFVLVLASGSGLASLQFAEFNQNVPYTAGGILGNVVGLGLTPFLNVIGTTLILMALLCSGLTLFIGFSWLSLIDGLGYYALRLLQTSWNAIRFVIHKLTFSLRLLWQKWRMREKYKQESSPSLQVSLRRDQGEQAEQPNTETAQLVHKQAKPSKARAAHSGTNKKASENIQQKVKQPNQQKKSSQVSAKDKQQEVTDDLFPKMELLDEPQKGDKQSFDHEQLEEMSREVEARIKDFGIEVQVVAVHPGPVITRFELQLAPGVKASRITNLAKDLARSLSVTSVRVVEIIPGKSVVGLELPNQNREIVRLSEILNSKQYNKLQSPLALALGKDIAGTPVIADLTKMPHMLVAGTTGSGKSVGINAILLGLLYKSTPEQLRLILIDPKMLELSVYEGIPHLLSPVVTDMKEAANALRWCVSEMERRYRLMAALGVRNLTSFNRKAQEAQQKGEPIKDPLWQGEAGDCPDLEPIPYVVVVIDEFADMMMVVGKKVEQLIARIAQKARAAGIHLVLATQRPSVDVITGLIKANVPARIGYQVSSKIDSRTVLDQPGAEQLLGHGDMLYLPPGTSAPTRVHGAFVNDDEVHRVVNDWKQRQKPQYIEAIKSGGSDEEDGGEFADLDGSEEKDELYDQAVYIVTKTRRASISNIQRRLKIGYNRAARLVEEMEKSGIVSPMESNGSREVLASPPPEEDQ